MNTEMKLREHLVRVSKIVNELNKYLNCKDKETRN